MDPENSTIPHFFSIFSAILFICKCIYSIYLSMQFLLWKCALDPEMMRLPWGNEVAIEMKNEISCGRNEREWKKFHSLVAGTCNETGAMNEWKLISFIYSSWSSFPTAPACNTLMQLAATSDVATNNAPMTMTTDTYDLRTTTMHHTKWCHQRWPQHNSQWQTTTSCHHDHPTNQDDRPQWRPTSTIQNGTAPSTTAHKWQWAPTNGSRQWGEHYLPPFISLTQMPCQQPIPSNTPWPSMNSHKAPTTSSPNCNKSLNTTLNERRRAPTTINEGPPLTLMISIQHHPWWMVMSTHDHWQGPTTTIDEWLWAPNTTINKQRRAPWPLMRAHRHHQWMAMSTQHHHQWTAMSPSENGG